jgi:hypothetical protein
LTSLSTLSCALGPAVGLTVLAAPANAFTDLSIS